MPQEKKSSPLRTIEIIVVVIAIVGVGFVIFGREFNQNTATQTTDPIREGRAAVPVLSPATAHKVTTSNGFQALASYTDRGFEPNDISIQAGETVRFTNNSPRVLQVSIQGVAAGTPIAQQDFLEHTFDTPGTYTVVNSSDIDTSKKVTIHVQ